MRHHLASLIRNLASGLRLALFLPVSRLAFRIDLAQLLLLFAVSAGIDVGVDWVRYGEDGEFSWLGLGNEVFSAGLLLLASALLALAFRRPPLALALPVLVLAAFPLLQALRVAPAVLHGTSAAWEAGWAVFDIVTVAWVLALCARAVAIALGPLPRGRWWRALAGGLALIAPMWVAPWIAADDKWWAAPAAESEFDPNYPNPASEPVLAAQRHLLDEALADLEDERPEATDLYFALFQHGLAKSDSLLAAFETARARLGGTRPQEGRPAGPGPQAFVGAAMAQKLKELDRGSAARRSGRSI